MRLLTTALAALVLGGAAAPVFAQESGVTVRDVRVLATDPEAVAAFYEKAFGMSETDRPMNTPTFKEIIINSGSTAAIAKKATSTPIVIATRPKDSMPAPMATLILQVPNLEKTIDSVKAAGGALVRGVGQAAGVSYAMVKDTDGNQIEIILKP
jgi:predicted enzyme related to lactoylglutathione lyase